MGCRLLNCVHADQINDHVAGLGASGGVAVFVAGIGAEAFGSRVGVGEAGIGDEFAGTGVGTSEPVEGVQQAATGAGEQQAGPDTAITPQQVGAM